MADITRRTGMQKDVTHIKKQRSYSAYTLIAEIARYLNISCLEVNQALQASTPCTTAIVKTVNEHNKLLYDWIIPHLFESYFEIVEFTHTEEHEVTLVNEPADGYFRMKAHPDLLVSQTQDKASPWSSKSFHPDHYCFDSRPENELFWWLLSQQQVQKVWFTDMLMHSQSDFRIHYVDPEPSMVQSYYPDFLIQKNDNSYLMIKVKDDNMIDDQVVKAKARYAEQLATGSQMGYTMVKGSEVASFKL